MPAQNSETTAQQLADRQLAADKIQARIHRLVAIALEQAEPRDALGAVAVRLRRSAHSLRLATDPAEGISSLLWGGRRDGLNDERLYFLVRHAWNSATANLGGLCVPALNLKAA